MLPKHKVLNQGFNKVPFDSLLSYIIYSLKLYRYFQEIPGRIVSGTYIRNRHGILCHFRYPQIQVTLTFLGLGDDELPPSLSLLELSRDNLSLSAFESRVLVKLSSEFRFPCIPLLFTFDLFLVPVNSQTCRRCY